MKKKQRYKYIFHQEVPTELKIEYDDVSKEYMEMKMVWSSNCSNYRNNPNHHFNMRRGMIRGDKIIQITEIQDNWVSDKTPTFSVIREIHKKGNHKFVEIVDLYECLDCGVYCRGRNSLHIPFTIYKGLEKTILSGNK
jgi:hypothetical protein|tara:strand:- start:67 stop:480 length:414 start_codon:yes stop_codon:yes gene_type:complete